MPIEPPDVPSPEGGSGSPSSSGPAVVTQVVQGVANATEIASAAAEGDTAAIVSSSTSAAVDTATAAAPQIPAGAQTAMQTGAAATTAAANVAAAPSAASAVGGAADVAGATGMAPAGTPQVASAVAAAAGNIAALPTTPAAQKAAATTAPVIGSPAAAIASMFSGTPEPVMLSFEAPSVSSAIWTASAVTLSELLSGTYSFDVELQVDDFDADPTELLGAAVVVRLRRGGLEREIAGIVEEVSRGETPSVESHTRSCHVHVVPALALLAYRKNTRMFPEMTVTEILKKVLEPPLQEFDRTVEFKVDRALPKYEYRMQYDETDLAFAQRLIGEEGLFYFFYTKDGIEHLVIADDASKYVKLDGEDADRLPYVSSGNADGHEGISGFRQVDLVRPNKVSLRHWNWAKASLETAESAGKSDPNYPDPEGITGLTEREVYEHDSRPVTFHQYSDDSGYGDVDIDDQVKLRRHQHVQASRSFLGDSTCTGLSVGTVFELMKHPDDAMNGEYAVISIAHSIHVGDAAQASGAVTELEATYSNHFTCVPATLTYRAPRTADKPRMRGIVTARVVGEGSEEIHTDKHGRVKVQFHWDRTSNLDAQGACFIRCAQMMAGQSWGSYFIPRVGMEVVVQFLDGDPDRPLITGTVYNGENHLPFPDKPMKSGFKTRSTPEKPDGYNEFTFDDSKDEEQIVLHAQKDLNETVENAHSMSVGAGQSISVGGDRSVSTSGKETYSVTKDRETTITGNDTHTVDAGKKYSFSLGSCSITIENGKIVMTNGSATLSMDGDKVDLKSHSGGQVYLTNNALMQSADGSKVKLDAAADLKSSSAGQVYLTGDALMQSGGGKASVHLTSDAEMQGSNATMSAKTKASVSGATVEVTGSATAKVATGGSSVETTPAGTTAMGSTVTVQGSGMVTISGPVVTVN